MNVWPTRRLSSSSRTLDLREEVLMERLVARVLAEAAVAVLPLVAGVLDGDGAHSGSIIGSPSTQHFSGQSGSISSAIRSPSSYPGLASANATCACRHLS